MEILAALGGAVLGALVSVAIGHAFSARAERKRALAALRAELQTNLETSDRILQSNRPAGSQTWYEFIPFSNTAWTSFVAQGMPGKLDSAKITLLSRAYATVESANFQARKIQMGTFKPRDAEEYTDRVETAREVLDAALSAVEGS